MRIAVTYADGQVFQHFGRTEQFKIYDISDSGEITSDIRGCNGASHSGVAAVLQEIGADVLICGGMGEGAYNRVTSLGINLVSGITGDADDAVRRYLAGELSSAPTAGVHACHGH